MHGASKEIQQGDYPKKYLAYILGSALLQKELKKDYEGERLIYQAFELCKEEVRLVWHSGNKTDMRLEIFGEIQMYEAPSSRLQ